MTIAMTVCLNTDFSDHVMSLECKISNKDRRELLGKVSTCQTGELHESCVSNGKRGLGHEIFLSSHVLFKRHG